MNTTEPYTEPQKPVAEWTKQERAAFKKNSRQLWDAAVPDFTSIVIIRCGY